MKLKNAGKVILGAALAVSCMLGLTGCSSASKGNISNTMTFSDGDKIAEIVIENYGTIRAKLFPDIAPNGVKNFEELAKQGYYNGLKIHRVAEDMCIQGGSLYGDGTGGTAVVDNTGSFATEVSADARNFYGALGYANTNGNNTTQFYIVTAKKPEDITKYSAETVREKAAEFTAAVEGMENTDPNYAYLNYMGTYYTALADMIEGAGEEITKKYAEVGGYPLWDGGYTVFGQVFEGWDVIDAIAAVDVITDKNGEKCMPVEDIIISSVNIIEYVTPQEETGETGEQ
ncbi:MAG: peptidylprolyl isomerase [Ruminococcus sp.]|nr:peptidylprolyl isomerase [Ruminococcus sp.]